MKTIYLAGGCFWGVEAYFRLKGFLNTEVGYAQGYIYNPTYEQVCTKTTGHTETLKLGYDSSRYNLADIFDLFFQIIDPTSLNKQGNDVGNQYRTGIYLTEDEDINMAKKYIESISNKYDKPIVVEVEKLRSYFSAETYHQQYLEKNPNGYCHLDLSKYR